MVAFLFKTLAARLISNPVTKKVRNPRTQREWTTEEKVVFLACMVSGRLAIDKSRDTPEK